MNIEDMTVKQLREVAEQMGLAIPSGAKKAEIIELIEDAAPEETGEDTTEAEAPEETGEDTTEDKPGYQAYVGPSLPGGLLPYGKILYGTRASIAEYLRPVLERYPKIQSLMVPIEDMNRAMQDVKDQKKLLYHLAQEIEAETHKGG